MAGTKTWNAHLNIARNELQNAVVQKLSSAPSSPVEGLIYYDTTLHQFGVYNASQWVYLAIGGTDTEAVQDIVAALLTPGSIITATYDDPNNTLTLNIGTGVITNAHINNSAAISADKTADGTTNKVYTATEKTKLAGIATGATNYTDTNARANRLDQFAAPTVALSLNGQRIISLADPTSAQDAATKNYVDTANTTASAADRARVNHTGTQLAATISDFDTQVRTSRLDQFAAPTAPVSLNNQRLTGVADPTSATDAVNKQYADGLAGGLDFKGSVLVATTGNITLSGEQTIDGVSTSASRVLVKNQTTASANGIYVSGSGTWARATDADASNEVTSGMLVYVEQGAVNGTQQWVLTTAGAITLGTTALTFTQYSGASTLTAGNGLTASGNQFNIGAGTGITVAADAISIDTSLVPQKKIFSFGDGSATSFTLTHNLNSQDVVVSVRDASTNEIDLGYQVVASTVNTVTVSGNSAPATNALRAVVIG